MDQSCLFVAVCVTHPYAVSFRIDVRVSRERELWDGVEGRLVERASDKAGVIGCPEGIVQIVSLELTDRQRQESVDTAKRGSSDQTGMKQDESTGEYTGGRKSVDHDFVGKLQPAARSFAFASSVMAMSCRSIR